MSLSNDAFVRARLTTWQRRITETAAALVPPEADNARAAITPTTDELVAVHNLATGLLADLRQSADSPLASTTVGREYLAQLATALVHTNRAATHLSTALTGLADTHRLAYRHAPAATAESQLALTLGHAAALRSLKRALQSVTGPLPKPAPTPGVAEQHQRATDAAGPQSPRRRP
ncbi:hypothetical protein AB0E08_39055 [Streptomyces sp. NPDC048281]|uniref:hypothetical protein n=1 Tax=Streptomyces sp. NPDC048281 TaxID=3154715 RepID=UPI0034213D37